MPGTGSATSRGRRGCRGSGSATSSQAPARRRSDLPTGRWSRVTRAGGGEVGRLGAGEAEQPRERRVDPLALEPVGDGQRPHVSHVAAPVRAGLGACRGARAPSTPMPRSARKPISMAAVTMAESATLKIDQCGS